jgi:curved DNA-binding protein CbpA
MNMRVGRWEAEQDFYAILGISASAPPSDVRRARRRLALKHHPDRPGATPEDVTSMKAVNLAASVLLDPSARARYDALRLGATWPTPPMPAARTYPRTTAHTPRARPVVTSSRAGASAISPWLFAAALAITALVGGVAKAGGGPVPVSSSEYRIPAGPQIASLWAD